MKRKFEELRENLEEFVEQADYPLLVVGATPEEQAYVITFFQALDEKHPEGFFVVFCNEFVNAPSFVDGMVQNLNQQREGANHLRAERGEEPFPPIPPGAADHKVTPEVRLELLLKYLGSLVPNTEDHYVAVGILPLECHDYDGYCRLVEPLVPAPDVPPYPWMRPLRVVVWEDRKRGAIFGELKRTKNDRCLTFEVDFSTPRLTDALASDAADTSLPLAERMSCLMQLAALDYSYKRYPDSIEKYGALYRYYEAQEVPAMQAMCLLGVGDALRAGAQPKLAKETYQRGLALAISAKTLPVMLNLLISVTGVCFDLMHHADAESYADSGSQVAAGSLNPFAYADMIEQKGDAQVLQGKTADGLVTYRKCEEICEKYEYFHRWKSVLEKQVAAYEGAHMDRARDETRHRLDLITERERRGEVDESAHARAS
jgi:tetratricopeptide (TPR) repeat protein